MELLIDQGGNIDDDVERQEIGRAVWQLGQVCIRICRVASIEVSVQPALASPAALTEAKRWIECLAPDEVTLVIDETNGITETFSNYINAVDRIEYLDEDTYR